ncbi:hypothetical protein [Facklamia miroungae]|uniref:Uncharacterized protein n=1 Tax=Facklamia miroungae TaxID=120956 RepID=A0A1G7NYN7_9LACT|nr:hypothetical protein [Facklamia miroungae]NKZ28516.1 hypothetical protein [Facklamia miroungae]SDF79083.1 hypothetical protein SAMN05421791_10157 [Facklamia miroungae]
MEKVLIQAIILDKELCEYLRGIFKEGCLLNHQILSTIHRGKKQIISRDLMFNQLKMEEEYQKEKASAGTEA